MEDYKWLATLGHPTVGPIWVWALRAFIEKHPLWVQLSHQVFLIIFKVELSTTVINR